MNALRTGLARYAPRASRYEKTIFDWVRRHDEYGER
jgi:predicted dithiol-disulfide oxidoreductase (DUF899 family)